MERDLQGQEYISLHPLEAELVKLENVLEAMEACPPLWWADKLLWRGLRGFYRMRQRRVQEAWDELREKEELSKA